MTEKWEYKFYKYENKIFGGNTKAETELKAFGEEGWEAVNFALNSSTGTTTGSSVILFKRRL